MESEIIKNPKLIIVVHAEEVFNWEKPFSRDNTGVAHIPKLSRYQNLFSDFNASVAYALTYPVADNNLSATFFKKLSNNHQNIYFGMHCHPWVNPPFVENVNNYNSYPGNLPQSLEAEKLKILSDKIQENIECLPLFYLAGRYGIGENTYSILSRMGIKVDFSPVPFYDYSKQEGPNFSDAPSCVTRKEGVSVIPHSSGFTGWLTNGGEKPSILNNKFLVQSRITSFFRC